MTRITELVRKIPDIAINTAEKAVRTKSRDYFFWSPILKAQLDHVTADAVVSPKNESEVMRTLAASSVAAESSAQYVLASLERSMRTHE